jgi:hypothetical protein
MYSQQLHQQQQIFNSNFQFLFHHNHYYPQSNQQRQQSSVYSQLQPFQQYPHQQQYQLKQTYATNQPTNSQQIVFQPPINQPTERTDDQIRQSKVLKRPDEVLDKNNELITRVELKSD